MFYIKGSGDGCVFVAALLHYLTLTTMMWMAVEARNMYVSTVKVFPEDTPRYMVKACLIAWGEFCSLYSMFQFQSALAVSDCKIELQILLIIQCPFYFLQCICLNMLL